MSCKVFESKTFTFSVTVSKEKGLGTLDKWRRCTNSLFQDCLFHTTHHAHIVSFSVSPVVF